MLWHWGSCLSIYLYWFPFHLLNQVHWYVTVVIAVYDSCFFSILNAIAIIIFYIWWIIFFCGQLPWVFCSVQLVELIYWKKGSNILMTVTLITFSNFCQSSFLYHREAFWTREMSDSFDIDGFLDELCQNVWTNWADFWNGCNTHGCIMLEGNFESLQI